MKKLLVTLATAALLASPIQANASSFEVSIPQATNLDPATNTLSINVSGIPEGQGIYFMLCEGNSATPRPANCSAEHQAWLSIAPASLRMGAVRALPVNEFKIVSKFATRAGTEVDCTKASCGVLIRRDHFGTTDLSLDRFIPITFAAPKPAANAIIGSFGNRVAVRVFGGEGKNVSIRVAGRWIKAPLTSNNVLKSFRVGAKSVNVEVFLDGQRLGQQRVVLN
jgi:hypothetical protein